MANFFNKGDDDRFNNNKNSSSKVVEEAQFHDGADITSSPLMATVRRLERSWGSDVEDLSEEGGGREEEERNREEEEEEEEEEDHQEVVKEVQSQDVQLGSRVELVTESESTRPVSDIILPAATRPSTPPPTTLNNSSSTVIIPPPFPLLRGAPLRFEVPSFAKVRHESKEVAQSMVLLSSSSSTTTTTMTTTAVISVTNNSDDGIPHHEDDGFIGDNSSSVEMLTSDESVLLPDLTPSPAVATASDGSEFQQQQVRSTIITDGEEGASPPAITIPENCSYFLEINKKADTMLQSSFDGKIELEEPHIIGEGVDDEIIAECEITLDSAPPSPDVDIIMDQSPPDDENEITNGPPTDLVLQSPQQKQSNVPVLISAATSSVQDSSTQTVTVYTTRTIPPRFSSKFSDIQRETKNKANNLMAALEVPYILSLSFSRIYSVIPPT
jgi:hypothetical protein